MPARSILCPVDFSAVSFQAYEHAVALAAHSGARLAVVYAIEPLLAQTAKAGLHDDYVRDTYAELRAFLGAPSEPLAPWTPPPALVVAVGEPWRVILETAGKHGADLIVMGTQGIGGLRRVVFGSTTERVLRAATLPVMAVPPGARPRLQTVGPAPGLDLGVVVAAVDFSATSEDVARTAAAFADEFDTRLVLVHAIPERAPLGPWQAAGATATLTARAAAEAALEALVDRLECTRPAETAIVDGPPAEALTDLVATRGAGLLVLGTASSVSEHRPGSTAYRVLCLTDVPVLAVPPPGAPAADRSFVAAGHHELW